MVPWCVLEICTSVGPQHWKGTSVHHFNIQSEGLYTDEVSWVTCSLS